VQLRDFCAVHALEHIAHAIGLVDEVLGDSGDHVVFVCEKDIFDVFDCFVDIISDVFEHCIVGIDRAFTPHLFVQLVSLSC